MNYGHPDGGLEIKAIDDEVRRQLHVAAEERGITGDQVIYPGEAVASDGGESSSYQDTEEEDQDGGGDGDGDPKYLKIFENFKESLNNH